jgi:Pol polyprotein, beta-barrel domain
MHDIAPVKIDIDNGESFTANQRGTIRIKIASNPQWEVPDVPITLTDIIYAPKLKSNLLSVGHMTNSDVSVYFGKYLSWLTLSGKMIAYRSKENKLYTDVGFPIPPRDQTADYMFTPSDQMLWHYWLAHTSHHTIENMRKLQTATDFHHGVHHGPLPLFWNPSRLWC